MSFNKKTIRDINCDQKRVLLRAALNVPIQDSKVVDVTRLKAAMPTIQYLLKHKAKVILLSHHSTEGESLKPVAKALEELLGQPVQFVPDAVGDIVWQAVSKMLPASVVLLENLRFNPQEEANDPNFAKALAKLGELYVDDDFTTMHRAHASIVGIPKFLPAVAGFLVEKEVEAITAAIENPTRPLMAIIGGAKISTKVPILNNLLTKVDSIFVAGAMANTFFAAQGLNVGKSVYEPDQEALTKEITKTAASKNIHLFLPTDIVVTTDIKSASNVRTVSLDQVKKDDIIVDAGPNSIEQLKPVFQHKGTVIWNGTLGIAENPAFAKGSEVLAKSLIESKVTSLIGGGDTVAFITQAGLESKFSHVSTGGGASLELMSGQTLPGVAALMDK